MTYSTEANKIKGRQYRAKHRKEYQDYQRAYQFAHYGEPTIRLIQVRANIKRNIAQLAKWKKEEQDLMELQAKPKEPTLGDWLNAKEVQSTDISEQ
jgi:hypothetical protein